jgi:hypothetical protein
MDKQKKELILLVIGMAVVGLAAYFSFRPKAPAAAPESPALSPPKAVARARPAREAAATEAAGGVEKKAETPDEQAARSADKEPAEQVPAGKLEEAGPQRKPGRDPFEAPSFVGLPGGAAVARGVGPATTAASARAGAMLPGSLRIGPLPTIPPLSVLVPGGPGGPQPVPGMPAFFQQEKLRLTGIIHGDPAIAILRKGERRFIVREGDPVGARYIVTEISGRRVVLGAGEHDRVILYLPGR